MRTHTAFGELARPFGSGSLGETVVADSLIAARFEPVVRAGKGCGVVDLIFRRDGRNLVVPLVLIDVVMLEARERDLLVWPESMSEGTIDEFAIAARIENWVAELFEERRLNAESWKIFGDDADGAIFASAREAGFLGAAPLEVVARRAAPYVFAMRHVRGRDVRITARDAALGASILERVARRVEIVSEDAAGVAWYAPHTAEGSAQILIVDRSHSDNGDQAADVTIDLDAGGGTRIEPAPVVPLDVMFDFSGTVRRGEPSFGIRARRSRNLEDPVTTEGDAVGGSSGRILFVLRHGARRFGGADVDYAETLAGAMRDEGFTVGIIEDPAEIVDFQPNLIHAFGLADSALAATCQRAAAAMQVPFAIHPFYDAAGHGGYWGATVTPYCYRFMQDEAMVRTMLDLVAEKRLAVNDICADAPYHPTNTRWEQDARAAVSGADVVYVTGPGELAAVRQLGIEGEALTVLPPVPHSGAAAAIDAIVGSEPYALLHAPIESTQNQLQAVRAARIADLPLVLAGPVADPDYASLVRAFANERTVIVGEPDAATLEGLYRGAHVFLDASWVGCGLARAAKAVSRGAALAISARLPGSDLGLEAFTSDVDPARPETIARGLADAWYRRQEEPEAFREAQRAFVLRAEVREVTRRVVTGYAKVLERRKDTVLR